MYNVVLIIIIVNNCLKYVKNSEFVAVLAVDGVVGVLLLEMEVLEELGHLVFVFLAALFQPVREVRLRLVQELGRVLEEVFIRAGQIVVALL